MNLKKIISFITATIMMSLFCIGDTSSIQYFQSKIVASAEETYSGYCGENCTYSFDSSTGTLTISGTGDMENYSSVSEVPWYSFKDDIKQVVINSGVTSIGNFAFYECTSLTKITMLEDSVAFIGDDAFYNCTSLTNITIPSSVTYIGVGTFWNCKSLTNIIIPNSVKSIDIGTFSNCTSLKSITIPNSVTSIGKYAFYYSNALTDVYYSGTEEQWGNISIASDNEPLNNAIVHYESMGSCGDNATCFFDDATSTLTISGTGDMDNYTSSTNEPWYSFKDDIKKVVVSNGITSIGYYAFCDCKSLTNITIPDSVRYIGCYAFSGCASLTNITIPNSVKSIDNGTFHYCTSLTNIIIPDSVMSINTSAFSYCKSLTNITIPDSVTSIGDIAFCGCESLTSITIPNSVTSIGDSVFHDCTLLTDVYYNGTEEEWNNININSNFNETLTKATIHYIDDMEEVTEPEEPIVTEPPVTTTEPSTETKDNTIIFGKDNWNILNQCSYFGQDGNDYYISQEDYTKLWSNLTNIEKIYIKNYKNSSWGGSCYGMSVTEILAKNGIFSTKDWFNSADCLSKLPTLDPEEISAEESLINYYQMLQLTTEVQQEITNTLSNKEQSQVLED